jgi:hypothetical protein
VKVLMLMGFSFSIFSSLRKLKMLTVLRICCLSSHVFGSDDTSHHVNCVRRFF